MTVTGTPIVDPTTGDVLGNTGERVVARLRVSEVQDKFSIADVMNGAEELLIGQRCVMHAGAVIGADGFGFAPDRDGYVKVPQVGGVRIGNDVEIGANTTVDRGAIDDTVIEDGVKLDNLVQVGHNVRIGEHTVVAGCAGISGSTTIGKRCMIGGSAGLVGHIELGDDVLITGLTMVTRSLKGPGIYSSGMPSLPAAEWRKTVARLRRLQRLERRVASLEGREPGTELDTEES